MILVYKIGVIGAKCNILNLAQSRMWFYGWMGITVKFDIHFFLTCKALHYSKYWINTPKKSHSTLKATGYHLPDASVGLLLYYIEIGRAHV